MFTDGLKIFFMLNFITILKFSNELKKDGLLPSGFYTHRFIYIRPCNLEENIKNRLNVSNFNFESKPNELQEVIVNGSLSLTKNVGPVAINIKGTILVNNRKIKLPSIKMRNVCEEKFTQFGLMKMFNFTNKCIIPKSNYTFQFNANKMTKDTVGDAFLYGTFEYKFLMLVKKLVIICAEGQSVFTRKNK